MLPRISVLTLALACVAGTLLAGHVVSDVGGDDDADWPALACSPGGATVIAWQDGDDGIWTQVMATYPPEEGALANPQVHGPGQRPQVVWTWQGFVLAWTAGTEIRYGISTSAAWIDPPRVIDLGVTLDNAVLDVHGLTDAGGDVAWFVIDAPDGEAGREVLMVTVREDGSHESSLVAGGLDWMVSPQVVAAPGDGPPRGRVFYFRNDTMIACRTEETGGGWSPEVVIPYEMFGTEMAAAAQGDGAAGILSLGPQPTCPCNVIGYVHEAPAGVWQEPEPLTVDDDYYDWPGSPCLAFDEDARTHAFWHQLGSDPYLMPHRHRLEYRVREDGVWSDRGDFLDDEEDPGLGSRVAMALAGDDQPVFAWTRKDTVGGVPLPRVIVLARPRYPLAIDESLVPTARATLRAWPNPFNPRLTVSGSATVGAPVSLTVHDLAGRRLAVLPVRPDDRGRFTTSWNGSDRAGRTVSAGVYLIRLAAGGEVASRRVVLAR